MVRLIPTACEAEEASADAKVGHKGNHKRCDYGVVHYEFTGRRFRICNRKEERGGQWCDLMSVWLGSSQTDIPLWHADVCEPSESCTLSFPFANARSGKNRISKQKR